MHRQNEVHRGRHIDTHTDIETHTDTKTQRDRHSDTDCLASEHAETMLDQDVYEPIFLNMSIDFPKKRFIDKKAK